VGLDAPGIGESSAVYPEVKDLGGFKIETRGIPAEIPLRVEAEIRSAAASVHWLEAAVNTLGAVMVPSGPATAAGSEGRDPEGKLCLSWAFLSFWDLGGFLVSLAPGRESRNSQRPDARWNWNHRWRNSVGGQLQNSDPNSSDGIPVDAKLMADRGAGPGTQKKAARKKPNISCGWREPECFYLEK
jgi:hypothetical protein